MSPLWERAAWTAAVALIVVGAISCWMDVDALDDLARERTQLRERYAKLKGMAVNLDLHRQQYQELDDVFGVLLMALPNAGTTGMGKAIEDAVRAEADRFGLRAVSVDLAVPERRGESMVARRVDISAVGEFRGLVSFLQSASIGSGGLRTVEYVALSREPNGRGLAMVAELKAHGLDEADDRRRPRRGAR